MNSKEALKEICKQCEYSKSKNYQLCPFRSISNDYCEEYEIIKKDLERLEQIDKMFNQEKPDDSTFVVRNSKPALYGLHCLALKNANKDWYWLSNKLVNIIEEDLDMLELIKEKLIIDIYGDIRFLNKFTEKDGKLYEDPDKIKVKEWLKDETETNK